MFIEISPMPQEFNQLVLVHPDSEKSGRIDVVRGEDFFLYIFDYRQREFSQDSYLPPSSGHCGKILLDNFWKLDEVS